MGCTHEHKKSTKKLYQLNNDTGKCHTTLGGIDRGRIMCWTMLVYPLLWIVIVLRGTAYSVSKVRCGDSGLTKYGYVNTHIWDFSLIFHLFIISFAFWIKLITLQYHSCLITVSAYWSKYFICRDQYYWHGAVQLSRYIHMPPLLYYSFENYSLNLNWCGFQRFPIS